VCTGVVTSTRNGEAFEQLWHIVLDKDGAGEDLNWRELHAALQAAEEAAAAAAAARPTLARKAVARLPPSLRSPPPAAGAAVEEDDDDDAAAVAADGGGGGGGPSAAPLPPCYKGVHRGEVTRSGVRWRATWTAAGRKKLHLGTFDAIADAARAYDACARASVACGR
jgi:hypothetical protein